jgi:hypothetical protein
MSRTTLINEAKNSINASRQYDLKLGPGSKKQKMISAEKSGYCSCRATI